MEKKNTLKEDYFKKVYEANDDPWNFKTSSYEKDKYAATLAALPRPMYDQVLEIGCSIGVLTELLAARCHQLLATDVSQSALDQAIERCRKFNHVKFSKSSFAQDLPDLEFDLIVISEVAYYLSPQDWEIAVMNLYHKLSPNGQIILVHWTPEVHDYPQTGDEVHESFKRLLQHQVKNIFSSREVNYRIDVWEKF